MGVAILASALMVLKLGALVIYDGIKKFLTRVQSGGMSQERGNEPLH